MLNTQPIAVLWDDSHVWGLMMLRALKALGFPVRVLKGVEISQGSLFRKQPQDLGSNGSLLVVPGGAAKSKALGLGKEGMQAIRDFVWQGGRYVGFCGGCGLALTHEAGLGLCPWRRASYSERVLHLISGHIEAKTAQHPLSLSWKGKQPLLPVWWPGKFSNEGGDVEVLAEGVCPGDDFWIADIPLKDVPKEALTHWKKLCGLDFSGDALAKTELAVHGLYGRGEYVLSYSHLETPASPDANKWLAHILASFTGATPKTEIIPDWNLLEDEGRETFVETPGEIFQSAEKMRRLCFLGIRHRLFFRRAGWLVGWKPGIPGSVCNNFLAVLTEASHIAPSPQALRYWEESKETYFQLATPFFAEAPKALLAARLAETISPSMPNAIDKTLIPREMRRLFGHPMSGGGLLGEMQNILEEYLYLCLRNP